MVEARRGIVRELGTLPFTLAVFSVHFYFVAYFISVVEIPKSLEGEPDWLVGLVVGGFGVAGMVTRPLAGVLVDSGNRQRWLRVGAVGTAVAFAGYALSVDPWTMLLFRLLHGVAMGLFTTSLLAMVMALIPERGRGLGIGLYQSSNALSQLYASAAAIWLTAVTSFEFVFLVGAAASGIALLFGMFVADRAPGAPSEPPPWGERQWISRTGLVPALVFLTMTTTMGSINAFLPLFADERSLGNVGLFYSVYALALLPARLLSGALSDRVGRGPVVVPALLMGAVSLLLLSTTQSQWMLLLVAVIYGLSFASVQVTAVALVVDRTPLHQLGAGMATYTMAWDVGLVLGSVLLGFVVELTSYATTFAVGAALPLLGLVFYATRMRAEAQSVPEATSRPGAAAGDGASDCG